MLERLFLDHPRTVNETYAEHWYVATRFGALMVLAGLGTMLHGFVPGILTRTGSNMIRKLHGEMAHRQASASTLGSSMPSFVAGTWHPEYEI